MKISNALYILLIIAVQGMSLSCQSESAKKAEETDVPSDVTLTQIPIEKMREMWDYCDHVDIIFYQHPVSISQNNQTDIRATLGFFSPVTGQHNPQCRSIGRIIFQRQGETMQEAEIYFSDECRYFIFLKDDKPTYLQHMAPDAINFLTQVLQMPPPTR